MATKILMQNARTGETVTGFYGFSWTTLFFGSFPALFRKDFITFIGIFVVLLILGVFTAGIGSMIAMIVWAFMYNKYYTVNLVKKGFAFAGTHTENQVAASRLGLILNADNCKTFAQ
ncbi:hypothetical protein RJE46_18110 [Cedecea neteri]|uniref:DUF2628 domain-containing protein n=1 Tax=Cedecea neteri TaxID=158822 RepID=A0AAN0S4M4_9ENTR|nr:MULTISPECIES: hypothetical protein [Cedecea]AIR61100.1 hypothetical protein LH23_10610 [Cedecea neteri]NIG74743.1 hypothetical protein [Klebsiella sp. Ap-873]WNJ78518.1 hypothetical protein RJE46_18110 [Cedecea neteri]SMG22861.1 hypothetical protein SAMN03159353_1004232 [Cedecea sp. NFIX57]